MELRLRGPNVVIRPDSQPDTSESGLHLVYDRQLSTMKGTVLALGNGPAYLDGEVRKVLARVKEKLKGLRAADAVDDVEDTLTYGHTVAVGDHVIFSPDAGAELFFESETLILVREDDILAIIDTE